jgi:hypothetical protein
VDRAVSLDVATAKAKVNPAQVPLLVEVERILLRA